MRSTWRVADIRASGIVAMFVLKNAVEDDKFLPTWRLRAEQAWLRESGNPSWRSLR